VAASCCASKISTAPARGTFERAVYEDLAWLGLAWEEPVRRQSEHFAEYAADLDRLESRGLLYPCFCTRREIESALTAPHGPEGAIYPGTCRARDRMERVRRIAAGEPFARRLDLDRALGAVGALSFVEAGSTVVVDPARLRADVGDVVLARKDVPASYHVAVVHDDALQGITLVVRGDDLAFATPLHRLLQALLGLPTPEYRHHRLITDSAGRRLAKRDGAATLHALRAAGVPPAAVRSRLGLA
jgi:glutamyl-Q tRNA(Asp) synthetase